MKKKKKESDCLCHKSPCKHDYRNGVKEEKDNAVFSTEWMKNAFGKCIHGILKGRECNDCAWNRAYEIGFRDGFNEGEKKVGTK